MHTRCFGTRRSHLRGLWRAAAAAITALLLAGWPVEAQEGFSAGEGEVAGAAARFTAEEKVTLANASPTYPVTPGDTYALTYVLPSGTEAVINTTVDATYELQLGHLGTIATTGMALRELRSQVEGLVRRNYPNAYPQLELLRVGLFRVFVSGAVSRAGWVEAWGLTHLSSVLKGRLAETASLRAVARTDSAGTQHLHDLFAPERLGVVAEDPFVHPGDLITVPFSERRVTIRGEVRRPGSYDLLPGEDFADLIGRLAGGATAQADPTQIEITRLGDEPGKADQYRIVDYADGSSFELYDQDSIYVPSVRENSPVVYVSIQSGDGVSTIRHRLRDGDTLLTVMKAVLLRPGPGRMGISDSSVSPESLSLGRIQRDGQTFTRVNIEALVFGGDESLDMRLQPGDTVVVP